MNASYTILRRAPENDVPGRTRAWTCQPPACPEEPHMHWTLAPFYVPNVEQLEQDVIGRAQAMALLVDHPESRLGSNWEKPWFVTVPLAQPTGHG